MLLLVTRWLPNRKVVAVADSSYAAIDLLAALCRHLTVITRLRLDARLFDPPPPRRPGTKGRPRVAGARQPTLLQRLADPKTVWQRVKVTDWYGQGERQLDIASGTALWYHPGKRVPVRWLLVRDPAGRFEPQAFACTDAAADPPPSSPSRYAGGVPSPAPPVDVLRWFVRRWSVEVTFAEVRRHLGVETQRQWSDLAIARTTPCLLALFSLVTLWVTTCPPAASFSPDAPLGTPRPRSPSPTPSPPSGANSGSKQLSQLPGPTGIGGKFPPLSMPASSKPLCYPA